ncbi:TauD/TfdA family dioxygenase [Acidocella sp.]|uniref:TauD/TfdA dioxygenase family protein n=1 Tax=Acidocella sp. TaxID=50710 RepID=UPI002618D792|nr:TauD/TfdA family dioxygenase [Acidocella sp.]
MDTVTKTSPLTVKPLREDLPFGARIAGLTPENIMDPAVRQQLNDVFIERGMIAFENVEQTAKMQVMISEVFGPLKDHPVKMVERLDNDTLPGVITIRTDPNAGMVEIDGKKLLTWQPWHFDHSYNNELNRAGVLRAEIIAPEGGLTGFCDGIQLYNDLPEDIKKKAEGVEVVYSLDLDYSRQPYGLPKNFKEISGKGAALAEAAKAIPRSVHPAVWTRETGEKVAHISPYGQREIVGKSHEEGAKLFAELWDAVEATITPYFHQWEPGDMVIWDNWRMLHMATGCDPKYDRIMHRTTIKGDYGLGRWETEPKAPAAAADAMA